MLWDNGNEQKYPPPPRTAPAMSCSRLKRQSVHFIFLCFTIDIWKEMSFFILYRAKFIQIFYKKYSQKWAVETFQRLSEHSRMIYSQSHTCSYIYLRWVVSRHKRGWGGEGGPTPTSFWALFRNFLRFLAVFITSMTKNSPVVGCQPPPSPNRDMYGLCHRDIFVCWKLSWKLWIRVIYVVK